MTREEREYIELGQPYKNIIYMTQKALDKLHIRAIKSGMKVRERRERKDRRCLHSRNL